MLYSILQIITFQALFLLVYDLFLKRETFHNYNRAYLIVTTILSIVLPFLKFPELKTMATKDLVIHLPEVFIGTKTPTVYDIQISEQAGIILEQPQTPLWQLIAVGGIVFAALIFIIKIAKLYYIKFKNPKRWQGNVLIVSLIKSSAAFSFFNTIFLGERIPETEKPIIYKHELVHIKEYHTIDLLFFELLRIVFWFNPLVYIYQNRIKELHEYIADAKGVKQSGKVDYYTRLLNQVLDVNQVSFTNTFFNKSLIKKRIAMLQKSKSKQLNLLKYALLIPMVFGMLIYTSTEVRAQQKDEVKEALNQELTDEQLIKKYYNNFLTMKENGSTFFEIAKSAGIYNDRMFKYLPSRTEFLKSKAYLHYISDNISERKSKDSTLTESISSYNIFRSLTDKFKTYEEFKTWKNTKEAKEHWESNTQDGILKLYVENEGIKTEEEQKQFDALRKQLESNDYYEMLVVASMHSTAIIMSPNHNIKDVKGEFEGVEVPFSAVEESPTTTECKDLASNEERKNCISDFINKHLGENFNSSLGNSLSPGKKRIFVQFKIDKDGTVKHIEARGPSLELELEAKRVIATLPQFIPGKQKGKVVVVPFSVPIVFQTQGNYKGVMSPEKDSLQIIEALRKQRIKHLKDSESIPYSVVDVAPIYADCTSLASKEELTNCTTAAVNTFVSKNFNTNLADSLGMAPGKKRIFAQFIIDKQGNITDIKARGPHPKLEEETTRVLKLLPQFTPGTHEGKVVNVPFSLPIVFEIHKTKKD